MEDFTALAARVAAGVGELRGCLIVSRDGLVLGAYPPDGEAVVKPAWLRFASMGQPNRGFLEFGDEAWCYVRRGAYAAFAVADANVRAGLVIDQLELALLSAEEMRTKRDALKVPDTAPVPSSKPRSSLHPETAAATPAQTPGPAPGGPDDSREERARPAQRSAAAPSAKGAAPPGARPSQRPPGGAERSEGTEDDVPEKRPEDDSVDRIALAQEFSRLLQSPREGDD